MKTFFFGDHLKNLAKTARRPFFFFGEHLKNVAKTTRRLFLTGLQFNLLDLYMKIVIICHYLDLKIVIILCSVVIFIYFLLIQRLDCLCFASSWLLFLYFKVYA